MIFVIAYFAPPFIAYRMGARGGWLITIILLSWIGFALWLVMRSPDVAIAQKREDAELERTLMIVRALNPAMADEIAEQKTYERLSALRPAPLPRIKARRFHPGLVLLAIMLLVAIYHVVGAISHSRDGLSTSGQAAPPSPSPEAAMAAAKARVAVFRLLDQAPAPIVVGDVSYSKEGAICISYQAKKAMETDMRRATFSGDAVSGALDPLGAAWDRWCPSPLTVIPRSEISVAISNATAKPESAAAKAKSDGTYRANMARAAVRILRRSLRDPSSLELEDIFTKAEPDDVCIVYRARNGFGALDLGRVVISTDDGILTDAHQWTSRCTGGEFYKVDTWVATTFN